MNTRLTVKIVAAALLMGCGGVLGGCPQGPATGARAEDRTPDAVYTTRGIVETLPSPDKPTAEFQVKHEAIDDFLNPLTGELGMNAMIMPFRLGRGVSLGDTKVGDKVSLTFAVWYKPVQGKPDKRTIDTYAVTKIEKLAPETELEFRQARPAKP
jgi:Cu/Ag efflux protein CusF